MVSLLLALAGCVDEPADTAVLVEPEPMDDVALLARLSLDLRGVRPTLAEIEAVEADPAALEWLVEDFLADERFEERLVHLYAQVWKTRADGFVVGVNGGATVDDGLERVAFARVVGEEPLRVIARVATEDRPYTDIVAVDWTMATRMHLGAFPNLEPVDDTGQDWFVAQYTDLRPAAGILGTNGLWWRYTSTVHNYNRGRAAALVEGLLCDSRFDQPVDFSRDAAEGDLEDQIQTDPACITCHVVLDPIGSYLFGFFRYHAESQTEATWYYPERERFWEDSTEVAPSYYGSEAQDSMLDLVDELTADPRVVSCATEQVYTFLHDESPGFEDLDSLLAHRAAFEDADLRLPALFAAVTAEPTYRSQDETVHGTVGLRRLSPDQLGLSVEALTGFTWRFEQLDQLENDTFGFRILAGGMDGMVVTTPATDHATSSLLVQQRLAEAAAAHAVVEDEERDLSERRLFTEVGALDEEPDADALIAQLQGLFLQTTGRRLDADDPELLELIELYDALLADTSDPTEAWRMTLSALLRHPDFVHY